MLNEQGLLCSTELHAFESILACDVEGMQKEQLLIRFKCLDLLDQDREFSFILDVTGSDYKGMYAIFVAVVSRVDEHFGCSHENFTSIAISSPPSRQVERHAGYICLHYTYTAGISEGGEWRTSYESICKSSMKFNNISAVSSRSVDSLKLCTTYYVLCNDLVASLSLCIIGSRFQTLSLVSSCLHLIMVMSHIYLHIQLID